MSVQQYCDRLLQFCTPITTVCCKIADLSRFSIEYHLVEEVFACVIPAV